MAILKAFTVVRVDRWVRRQGRPTESRFAW